MIGRIGGGRGSGRKRSQINRCENEIEMAGLEDLGGWFVERVILF